MYIGRSSPACLKPDRLQTSKRKSVVNIDQTLSDIQACLKYLSEGQKSLTQLRTLLHLLPSLRTSQSNLKLIHESMNSIMNNLNTLELQKQEQNQVFNKLKSPMHHHGNKSITYFLQRNINHMTSQIMGIENQLSVLREKSKSLNQSRIYGEEKAEVKLSLENKKKHFMDHLNKEIHMSRKKIEEVKMMDEYSSQMRNSIQNLQEYKEIEGKFHEYKTVLGMAKCMNHWMQKIVYCSLDKKMKVSVREKLERSKKTQKIRLNMIQASRKQKESLHSIEKQEKMNTINKSLEKNDEWFLNQKEKLQKTLFRLKQQRNFNEEKTKFGFQTQFQTFQKICFRISGLKKFYYGQIEKLAQNQNFDENKRSSKISSGNRQEAETIKKVEKMILKWENFEEEVKKMFEKSR